MWNYQFLLKVRKSYVFKTWFFTFEEQTFCLSFIGSRTARMQCCGVEPFFLGSGSRYFFSAQAPPKTLGSDQLWLKKIDFYKTFKKSKLTLQKTQILSQKQKKTYKKIDKHSLKNLSGFVLNCSRFNNLAKKGAEADPKCSAPALAQFLIRLWPKKLRAPTSVAEPPLFWVAPAL